MMWNYSRMGQQMETCLSYSLTSYQVCLPDNLILIENQWCTLNDVARSTVMVTERSTGYMPARSPTNSGRSPVRQVVLKFVSAFAHGFRYLKPRTLGPVDSCQRKVALLSSIWCWWCKHCSRLSKASASSPTPRVFNRCYIYQCDCVRTFIPPIFILAT